jgi:hypothetical protein
VTKFTFIILLLQVAVSRRMEFMGNRPQTLFELVDHTFSDGVFIELILVAE